MNPEYHKIVSAWTTDKTSCPCSIFSSDPRLLKNVPPDLRVPNSICLVVRRSACREGVYHVPQPEFEPGKESGEFFPK